MKNFDIWNTEKKKIEKIQNTSFFRERDILYIKMGLNIGFEQDGKTSYLRPAVVIKKFNNRAALIIPLSRTKKDGIYYFPFTFEKNIVSKAIISQIRFIDSKRFKNKIGVIGKKDFKELKKSIRDMI